MSTQQEFHTNDALESQLYSSRFDYYFGGLPRWAYFRAGMCIGAVAALAVSGWLFLKDEAKDNQKLAGIKQVQVDLNNALRDIKIDGQGNLWLNGGVIRIAATPTDPDVLALDDQSQPDIHPASFVVATCITKGYIAKMPFDTLLEAETALAALPNTLTTDPTIYSDASCDDEQLTPADLTR